MGASGEDDVLQNAEQDLVVLGVAEAEGFVGVHTARSTAYCRTFSQWEAIYWLLLNSSRMLLVLRVNAEVAAL